MDAVETDRLDLILGNEIGKGRTKSGRIEDLSELLLIADIERDAFIGLSRRLSIYGGGAFRIYSISVTSSRGGVGPIFVTRAILQATGHKSYQILKWQHNHG